MWPELRPAPRSLQGHLRVLRSPGPLFLGTRCNRHPEDAHSTCPPQVPPRHRAGRVLAVLPGPPLLALSSGWRRGQPQPTRALRRTLGISEILPAVCGSCNIPSSWQCRPRAPPKLVSKPQWRPFRPPSRARLSTSGPVIRPPSNFSFLSGTRTVPPSRDRREGDGDTPDGSRCLPRARWSPRPRGPSPKPPEGTPKAGQSGSNKASHAKPG